MYRLASCDSLVRTKHKRRHLRFPLLSNQRHVTFSVLILTVSRLPTPSFTTNLLGNTSIFPQPYTPTQILLDALRSSPWCNGFSLCKSVTFPDYTSPSCSWFRSFLSLLYTQPPWTNYDDSIPHHASEAFRTWNPRQVNWRSPDRHVLIIVNFRELADRTSQQLHLTPNADFLDAAYRVFLDALDENSLFTWCRHFNYRATTETTIGHVCDLISGRIATKPGIFTFLALTWNFEAMIYGERPSNSPRLTPSPRPWIHGGPAGAIFRRQSLRPKPFPGAQGAPLPYILSVTALFRVSHFAMM